MAMLLEEGTDVEGTADKNVVKSKGGTVSDGGRGFMCRHTICTHSYRETDTHTHNKHHTHTDRHVYTPTHSTPSLKTYPHNDYT